MTRISLVQLPNCTSKLPFSLDKTFFSLHVAAATVTADFLTAELIISSSFVSMVILLTGHVLIGFTSHEGPFHHNWLLTNLLAGTPLETKSAGLSLVGTCCQVAPSVFSCILATRCA